MGYFPLAAGLAAECYPMSIPFAVRKIGHAVIFVSDIERSKRFYTEVLGFQVSDVYDGSMMPGGMVFLRCNGDHHCLALVGDKGDAANGKSLHHIAFELATIDEVFRARDHLMAHGTKITFKAAAAPAARSRSSSSIPTAITSSSIGASTRWAPTAGRGLGTNGASRPASRRRCGRRRKARTRRCTTPPCAHGSRRRPTGSSRESSAYIFKPAASSNYRSRTGSGPFLAEQAGCVRRCWVTARLMGSPKSLGAGIGIGETSHAGGKSGGRKSGIGLTAVLRPAMFRPVGVSTAFGFACP